MKKLLLAPLVLALAAVPALAATRSVRLTDNRFGPGSLTVSRGTTLSFRNAGQAPHNVTASQGPVRFHSALLRHGQTYRHRMTRTGTYTLVCTIHAGMRMTVRVR